MHILIPTYRRPELLRRTLCSLSAARLPEGLEAVWVLENGADAVSESVCARMAERLPMRYVHLPQPGKSRALQWTVEQIERGLLIFLDDDVRLHSDCLLHYARVAGDRGGECFFGGPLRIDCDVPPPAWLRPYLPRSVSGWEPADAADPLAGDLTFLGANFAAWAEQVQKVGGFRANLGPGADREGTEGNPVGQESDLQQRLLAHGYVPVYVPEAEVWHYVPADRCSPQWALHRAFRAGLTSARHGDHPHVPRWLWRKRAEADIRRLLALFVNDPQRRFELQRASHQWRGYWQGTVQRREAA